MKLSVVGDVGGTHARFALADLSQDDAQIVAPVTLLCSDYACAEDALKDYLDRQGLARPPGSVVIAVAGPVVDGAIAFTNMSWRISEQGLRRFGFRRAALVNDYAALAFAGQYVGEDQVHRIGPQGGAPGGRSSALEASGETLAVLGAGTGFGVSALVRDGAHRAIMATEGGHIAFAPVDDQEAEVLRILRRRFGRVSIERILSGPGLLNLHLALCEMKGAPSRFDEPAQITTQAIAGEADARQTVDAFCAILGSVAGDFALSYGAKGGVYIAGGIAPRMLDLLERGPFRARFEAKGRFSAYVSAISTAVVTYPYFALLGGLHLLREGQAGEDEPARPAGRAQPSNTAGGVDAALRPC